MNICPYTNYCYIVFAGISTTNNTHLVAIFSDYLKSIQIYIFSEPTEFPTNLKKQSLGNVHSARWMNLGTRIIRLYVTMAKSDPDYDNVRYLVMFIVGYYAKVSVIFILLNKQC